MVNKYRFEPILKQHKLLLQDFWDSHWVLPAGRKGFSRKSPEETLDALKKLGTIELRYKTRNTHTREKFDNRKHLKRFTGFKYCFVCTKRPEVRHHIIWLKNGGRNHKKNIMGLCRPCHAEIHPWLKNK